MMMHDGMAFFYLGLAIGCLPIYGLRQSTLKCLYNSTCLKGMASFFRISAVLDPLDASVYSRFTPVSSVLTGTLIDELFIEMWQNTSNYSSYFAACAPSTCRYTYEQRSDAIYMLTTFLGLYGGLTVGLKFVIWHILNIYWQVRQWLARRQTSVEPMNRY